MFSCVLSIKKMFEKIRNFSPPKKRIDKPYGFFSVHETHLLKGKKKGTKFR